MVVLYKALVTELDDVAPLLISSQIRALAASSSQLSSLDTTVLFAANHPEDQIFSELELLFRRYNSNILTFAKINDAKDAATLRHLQAGLLVPLGEQDIGQIEIDVNDSHSIAELARIENLYRSFFRHLIADVEECKNVLGRLNENSERKLGKFRWDSPPRVTIQLDFQPIEYLRNLPPFSAADLPRVAVQ
jgi:hypothetical protein